MKIAVLTGGRDPYYALGLLSALRTLPISVDFLGSREMEEGTPPATNVRHLQVHRDSPPGSSNWKKLIGVFRQYLSLIWYAATTDARVFHILWYTKVEWFDNTILIAYYKVLGKRLVLTVHNVNRKARDGSDGLLNRLSLRFLYRQVDHIFVHTDQMKAELREQFGVSADSVSVIPFGANSYVLQSALTRDEARQKLGLDASDRVLVFFGNIAPYKGLDTLVDALAELPACRLIIAGSIKKGFDEHWRSIERKISEQQLASRIVAAIRVIPDEDVEIYFKSADVAILPYRTISQSGVLFLSYAFGVPVIATNVGGLAADVREGRTGYLCPPDNAAELAAAIRRFFESDLFAVGQESRDAIVRHLHDNHSWTAVAKDTMTVYASLSHGCAPEAVLE